MEQYDEDKVGDLMSTTHGLLKESGLKPQDVFAQCGLPFYWVKKFGRGEFENPSVNRVQFLYEFLTGTKLIPENK